MGFFTCQRFDSFHLVFLDQITDLYTAELRLVQAYPRMAEAASEQRLQAEFRFQLRETHMHVRRLERIFDTLNLQPVRLKRDPMKVIIAEVCEVIEAEGAPEVIDATLIGAAQRIVHYQIAAYVTAGAFACRIDRPDIGRWLRATVGDKKRANKNLAELAEFGINQEVEAIPV